MPPRPRKRGRKSAGDREKNGDRRGGAVAETGVCNEPPGKAAAEGMMPDDYSSMESWDKRYREGKFVEWYCSFDHVRPLFELHIPKDSRVLDVGCGDKPLAWDLRDAGYTGKICSFDFSPTVIGRLLAEKESCNRRRLDNEVEFKVLDARELPFEAKSFDLVVDKGTVDAMLCDESGKDSARATCQEAARVVAPGGWFVIVSHIHPSTMEGVELLSEVLVPGLQESASAGGDAFLWSIDVHCGEADGEDEDGEVDQEEDDSIGEAGGKQRVGEIKEDDGGATSLGPSVYMARKVGKRFTRSSAQGQHKQRAMPIRIHEY